jgi:predicted  nucleic acid-binding Zn-ribbon protein
MEVTKSIKELETELKTQKKLFDKVQKKLKKSRSSYEYEMLYDEAETIHEDILQLQLLIQEQRRKIKREREMESILDVE